MQIQNYLFFLLTKKYLQKQFNNITGALDLQLPLKGYVLLQRIRLQAKRQKTKYSTMKVT